MEIWREIKGFEGRYKISNRGRVLSVHRCVKPGLCYIEKNMSLQENKRGYLQIKLRKPQVYQRYFIHRLVALHFLEQIEGKDFVNHKDKNRKNNQLSNLEWCTHQENCDHRDGKPINNDEPF